MKGDISCCNDFVMWSRSFCQMVIFTKSPNAMHCSALVVIPVILYCHMLFEWSLILQDTSRNYYLWTSDVYDQNVLSLPTHQ